MVLSLSRVGYVKHIRFRLAMPHHPVLIPRPKRLLIHLIQTSYHFVFVALFTMPGRYRRPPISFSREIPVFHFFKPLAETAFFKMSGYPINSFVGRKKLRPEFAHRHEPRLPSVIKKGSIATPAVRIFVLIGFSF